MRLSSQDLFAKVSKQHATSLLITAKRRQGAAGTHFLDTCVDEVATLQAQAGRSLHECGAGCRRPAPAVSGALTFLDSHSLGQLARSIA